MNSTTSGPMILRGRDLSKFVAIVGMSGRFPGASSLEAHWQNVRGMKAAFERVDEACLDKNNVSPTVLRDPNYVNVGAFLSGDFRRFDAAFFRLSERRATFMDPQQRLFLECAWEALERAGYATRSRSLRIGVFGGTAANSYLARNILGNPSIRGWFDDQDIELGGNKDHAALNTAYALDLTGPAITVQSACSTSLLAVHVAARSILNEECDLALAGGVSLQLPQRVGYIYKEGGFLSKTGACRPFDARADGTIFASGAGIVVLKSYAAAIQDRDTIYAVILGSSINNDGASKAGYVAPSVSGQSTVIRKALDVAGVNPDEVAYVETHGTGTRLGDALEYRALLQAYEGAHSPCALGSVKANIGHLDVASGVAGLITATYVLRDKTIPGLAGYKSANQAISLKGSPFFFAKESTPFPASRNCVAVSSFGVGGTNVHMVLCNPAPREASTTFVSVPLIPISARTKAALAVRKQELRDYLRSAPNARFSDIAYTLQVGRATFTEREGIFSRSKEELILQLDSEEKTNKMVSKHGAIVYILSEISETERARIGATIPAVAERFETVLNRCYSRAEKTGVRLDRNDSEQIARITFNGVLLSVMRNIGLLPDLVILSGATEILRQVDPADPAQVEAVISAIIEGYQDVSGTAWSGLGATGTASVFLSNTQQFLAPEATAPAESISVDDCLSRITEGSNSALILDLSEMGWCWDAERFESCCEIFSASDAGFDVAIGCFLACAFSRGFKIDCEKLYGTSRGTRIPLPTYPFQRRQYWIDSAPPSNIVNTPGSVESTRSWQIKECAIRVLRDVAPVEIMECDFDRTFLDLGFDSLNLSQLVNGLARELKVPLRMNELVNEDLTPQRLLEYLDQTAHEPVQLTVNTPPPSPFNHDYATTELGPRVVSLGPYIASRERNSTVLSAVQEAYLRSLTEVISRRTVQSKAIAESSRPVFCDPRSIAGFDVRWKEIVYPIVAAESFGSKLVDVDGNRYIDMVMGFGAAYLGHAPTFVTEAIRRQLEKGYEIGPQTPLAADVARLISELTKTERVAFCNTGSEAVAAAMRVARTATRKEKVVLFEHSYHGGFDAVLCRVAPGRPLGQSAPISPGIPQSALRDTCLLKFGDDTSLDYIVRHSDEIAGVLVEPVQSRKPQNVPVQFLHKLREVCYRRNILLIFDEVITGFRCHLGGAQELFDVRADLALYGKVVGGGLPIGVIAGRACYMNHLDGGDWRFGDASVPNAELTFFAGTFVRHPLAMASAKAALDFMKSRGPGLQFEVTHRVLQLRDKLNDIFSSKAVPIKVHSFASFIAHEIQSGLTNINLLFPLLRLKGVYAEKERLGHFSIAHTEEDMATIASAYEDSINELIEHELIPGNATRERQSSSHH